MPHCFPDIAIAVVSNFMSDEWQSPSSSTVHSDKLICNRKVCVLSISCTHQQSAELSVSSINEYPVLFLVPGITFLLSIFSTMRGHRCRAISPPVYVPSILSRRGFSMPAARRFIYIYIHGGLSRGCTRAAEGSDLDQVLSRLGNNSS